MLVSMRLYFSIGYEKNLGILAAMIAVKEQIHSLIK